MKYVGKFVFNEDKIVVVFFHFQQITFFWKRGIA